MTIPGMIPRLFSARRPTTHQTPTCNPLGQTRSEASAGRYWREAGLRTSTSTEGYVLSMLVDADSNTAEHHVLTKDEYNPVDVSF